MVLQVITIQNTLIVFQSKNPILLNVMLCFLIQLNYFLIRVKMYFSNQVIYQ